jgi:hypothetical protein
LPFPLDVFPNPELGILICSPHAPVTDSTMEGPDFGGFKDRNLFSGVNDLLHTTGVQIPA